MFNSCNGTLPVSIPLGVGNNSGFGGNTFDDIIALAIVGMIFGWGNGGWGGYGGGQSTSVYEGYVLNNDMSMLQRSISDSTNMLERRTDNIVNGLCDGFYTTAQQFNTTNTNIMQGTNTLATQIGDVKYAIGSAGAEISRGVERGFADTNYNLADKFCQTNFNNERNTRNIIDATNAGFLALDNKIDSIRYDMMRDKYEAERDAKFALQGQLDRAQLRTQIVDDVRPCPKPAYITCNPFGCNCQQNLYGYGTTIA